MPSRPDRATLVDIPVVAEPKRGALSIVDAEALVPFPIRQVLCQYDMEIGTLRGGHAHRRFEQFLICVHGRMEVMTEDRQGPQTKELNEPRQGIYVPPLTWVTLRSLEPETVCLVLNSEHYDEADYVRDYATFRSLLESK